MVAVRQGLISEDVAGRATSLWPLILVGIGLSIALAWRPGTWETPGYASAEIRISLKADVNAGSLSLDPARTCAG